MWLCTAVVAQFTHVLTYGRSHGRHQPHMCFTASFGTGKCAGAFCPASAHLLCVFILAFTVAVHKMQHVIRFCNAFKLVFVVQLSLSLFLVMHARRFCVSHDSSKGGAN